jgi:peptidoglycan/xylan/chitin deacetylase (PgdA/CDA1 family)
MRTVRNQGFEVGIHCYNHYRWQDYLGRMDLEAVRTEFGEARREFMRIFGRESLTAGAAGWQSNALSREVYDEAGLLYSSDTRGERPFFPSIGGRTFGTLEIPSTLPTLDELMGRPEYPDAKLAAHLVSLLRTDRLNVFTLHAEIEGMGRRGVFRDFLGACRRAGVEFVRMDEAARAILADRPAVPVCEQVMAPIEGRSGLVATQAAA